MTLRHGLPTYGNLAFHGVTAVHIGETTIFEEAHFAVRTITLTSADGKTFKVSLFGDNADALRVTQSDAVVIEPAHGAEPSSPSKTQAMGSASPPSAMTGPDGGISLSDGMVAP